MHAHSIIYEPNNENTLTKRIEVLLLLNSDETITPASE